MGIFVIITANGTPLVIARKIGADGFVYGGAR
jgi:hypothetical protein